MIERIKALGLDTSAFTRFEERGTTGWPDEQVHVTLDVSSTVEAKWAALNSHRTQFGPNNPFRRLPEDLVKQLMSREHFALAWPEPTPGLQLPDLFSGL
jgi:LmbE family N-acetylglucosaminyl deacetylase